MTNGFTHYYKIKLDVDNGIRRYETWKYIFADNEDKAMQNILDYYNRQYDTFARVIEMYDCPVQDVMMFNQFSNE